MRFAQKVVVITGAGNGIGKNHAINFAKEGACVVVCDIKEDDCRAVVAAIKENGGEAIGVKADVTSEESVKVMMEKIIETYGRIDILVNNAGLTRDTKVSEMTERDWDIVLDVCLKGSFLCSKYTAPYMIAQKYGRIINTSSRAYLGNPGQANYSAAKAGIIGLTRALSKELGKYNITVNAIAPGLIDTAMLRALPTFDMIAERQIKDTPIKRIGTVDDVTKAVMFFASDDAEYISGDVLHVSGGRKG